MEWKATTMTKQDLIGLKYAMPIKQADEFGGSRTFMTLMAWREHCEESEQVFKNIYPMREKI